MPVVLVNAVRCGPWLVCARTLWQSSSRLSRRVPWWCGRQSSPSYPHPASSLRHNGNLLRRGPRASTLVSLPSDDCRRPEEGSWKLVFITPLVRSFWKALEGLSQGRHYLFYLFETSNLTLRPPQSIFRRQRRTQKPFGIMQTPTPEDRLVRTAGRKQWGRKVEQASSACLLERGESGQ